ncbi:segregation and condensation protein A [Actinacidiphila acidipaludis]|uniref:Segregation and condensation protein A n=1 Tax=Actinacidiphila acidipaludis TaxID=2873382 RepID=A0ABS7Q6Q6_9ACTN|nr:segregation/condensation protein A [Streptomyces acidipaludis]MBY8878536.1 segregation/condensation protein A [Streptomyces acidipaludis]
MPTTPDDPVAPRRRLGRGGAAAPAQPEAGREPVAEAVPQAVPDPEPERVPAPEPERELEAAEVAEAVPEAEPEPVIEADPEPVIEALAEPQPQPPSEPAPEPEAAPGPQPESEADGSDNGNRFTVRLANFEGPFDLLLQLISKHKLDVTEVALSKVTNEFMAHIHAMGPDWDLDQTTEFLVVAATLLDLKAARLLPAAEVEDEGDLALLEARDLLFARLLQYRAYKQIAAIFAERLETEALRFPRTVGLEPQHAELLPEVVLSIGPERFAQLAVKAMQPRPKPQVYVDHIHAPLVSVREQAEHVISLLRERGSASFGELTADAADTLTVVARFLALLELYREKAVALDQEEALGALQVRWTGGAQDGDPPLVTDEFDRETPADPDKRRPAAANPPSGTATQAIPATSSTQAASAAPDAGAAAPEASTPPVDTIEPGPAGEGEPS